MKKYLLMILFVTMLSACIKDYRNDKRIFIENRSGTIVELIRFHSGKRISYDTIRLRNGDNVKVLEISSGGKADISKPIAIWAGAETDSAVIIFNNRIKVTHLNKQHLLSARKNLIRYDDMRNIFNTNSYTIVSPSVNFLDNTYTFTEQDYLNAK